YLTKTVPRNLRFQTLLSRVFHNPELQTRKNDRSMHKNVSRNMPECLNILVLPTSKVLSQVLIEAQLLVAAEKKIPPCLSLCSLTAKLFLRSTHLVRLPLLLDGRSLISTKIWPRATCSLRSRNEQRGSSRSYQRTPTLINRSALSALRCWSMECRSDLWPRRRNETCMWNSYGGRMPTSHQKKKSSKPAG